MANILEKTKKDELEKVAKIYATEFSKPPYNEVWKMNEAIEKMKFYMKFYDLYTIKNSEEIIGVVAVNQNFMKPGSVALIEEFAIEEKNQRKGIGTWVIKELEKIYKNKKYKKILLISNKKSWQLNFYKKLDFSPSEEDILMEKSFQ